MQLKKNEMNEYYLSYYSSIGKRIKELFPFQIHRVCTCCYSPVIGIYPTSVKGGQIRLKLFLLIKDLVIITRELTFCHFNHI